MNHKNLAIKIIEKYYPKDSISYNYLVSHSKLVTKKAVKIAKRLPHLKPDIEFIEEAAMLHDIGIFRTNVNPFGCFGTEPYIMHGVIGSELLKKEGLPKHALVAERHIGVGVSKEDIENENLPLPKKNYIPITIEEEIICFSDLFFSKSVDKVSRVKAVNEVREQLEKFGEEKVKKFINWCIKFEES